MEDRGRKGYAPAIRRKVPELIIAVEKRLIERRAVTLCLESWTAGEGS